jgi:electron transfer flavoprotein alpha subunit
MAQAEELNSFMECFLDKGFHGGSTLLFYANAADRNELLGHVPTDRVELVRIDRPAAETMLNALAHLEAEKDTALYLFPTGFAGAELAVRWAFRRQGSSLVQVEQMVCHGNEVIARKKVYADHALATFRLARQPFCISPARGSLDRLPLKARDGLQITEHDMTGVVAAGDDQDAQWIPAEEATDLAGVKLLIVGGRGLGTRENVRHLKETAEAMGAAFGISRPLALNAWESMHRLIGVSGTIARPEICITAGVSGAAAFYAGIEKSKFIVAINTDPRARIIKAADVAVIDDYQAVMDALVKLFKKYA